MLVFVILSWFCIVAFGFFVLGSRYGWLFGSVTLLVAAIFNVLWPLLRPSIIALTVGISPVVWIISVGGVHLALGSNPSRRDVEYSGGSTVRQLEEYHATNGYYPESLKAAGIVSPRYRCGSFEYIRGSVSGFYLGIEDYKLDGFAVWWEPEHNTWYWDT